MMRTVNNPGSEEKFQFNGLFYVLPHGRSEWSADAAAHIQRKFAGRLGAGIEPTSEEAIASAEKAQKIRDEAAAAKDRLEARKELKDRIKAEQAAKLLRRQQQRARPKDIATVQPEPPADGPEAVPEPVAPEAAATAPQAPEQAQPEPPADGPKE